MDLKKIKMLILIFPALIAFSIALIPTLKYQWPLSWDIYYHVHMAKLYIEQGITFWDPLTCAPFGRPICYPPLFHFLLASLSMIFNMDPFKAARFLQPIFAMLVVFSFTWISYKFYGRTAGISTGLLIIYSYITFNRGLIASPGTLGLIIIPLVLYTYYAANEKDNHKYVIISGILSGIIFLIHPLSGFCLIFSIFLFTVVMRILKRKINLRYFGIFLVITLIIALIWWAPLYLIYNPKYNIFSGAPCTILKFLIIYFGVLPSLLAIIGGLFLIYKRRNKEILILSWMLPALILSKGYYFGLSVIPIRFLEIASYPLIVMAGIGFSCTLNFMQKKLDKRMDIKFIGIVILGILTSVSALIFVDAYTPNLINGYGEHQIFSYEVQKFFNPFNDPSKFRCIADRFGNLDLAYDRKTIVDWFVKNGDRDKVVLSCDSYMDTIIVSTSRVHVMKGGYSESIPSRILSFNARKYLKNVDKIQLIKNDVKYLLLKKDMEVPPYSKVVFQSKYYKICILK